MTTLTTFKKMYKAADAHHNKTRDMDPLHAVMSAEQNAGDTYAEQGRLKELSGVWDLHTLPEFQELALDSLRSLCCDDAKLAKFFRKHGLEF